MRTVEVATAIGMLLGLASSQEAAAGGGHHLMSTVECTSADEAWTAHVTPLGNIEHPLLFDIAVQSESGLRLDTRVVPGSEVSIGDEAIDLAVAGDGASTVLQLRADQADATGAFPGRIELERSFVRAPGVRFGRDRVSLALDLTCRQP